VGKGLRSDCFYTWMHSIQLNCIISVPGRREQRHCSSHSEAAQGVMYKLHCYKKGTAALPVGASAALASRHFAHTACNYQMSQHPHGLRLAALPCLLAWDMPAATWLLLLQACHCPACCPPCVTGLS
jgi:hypothetical protein